MSGEKRVYAPGCALFLYKPDLVKRLFGLLREYFGDMDLLSACCRNNHPFQPGTVVISTCPGCDRRYRANHEASAHLSLWEVLAAHDVFPLPDYGGKAMTIIDACPVRDQAGVHEAVRALLRKMDITLVEPEHTRTESVCCGDSAWGSVPSQDVKALMRRRTSEMPLEDVVVYCVSCSKSVFIGGKTPRYLIDLIFDEATVPGTLEPDQWHKEIDEFIAGH
jgi:hypothetical protein